MRQTDFLHQKFNRALWLRWGALGLILLPMIWWGGEPLSRLIAFLSNREAVTAYLDSFGLWGPLLLGLILSLHVFLALIPGHILMITGCYLYGFWSGLWLNLCGTVLVSQLAFVVLRRAGRPLVSRFVSVHMLDRWNRAAVRQGFFFFLLFFWFPLVPSNVMNIVAALGTISFWEFLAANFLGRLPGVVLVTLIGSHGLDLSTRQWFLLAGVGVVILGGGRYAANRLQARYFVHTGED